jgi:hypothetical protein
MFHAEQMRKLAIHLGLIVAGTAAALVLAELANRVAANEILVRLVELSSKHELW